MRPAQIAEGVNLQARILGAAAEEVKGATTLVTAALAHPLMARARDASRAGRCRRETPVTYRQPDGSLVEGVLDLAFEETGGWTIVDFRSRPKIRDLSTAPLLSSWVDQSRGAGRGSSLSFQFLHQLIEEAPVGALGDDLLRSRLDHPHLVEA